MGRLLWVGCVVGGLAAGCAEEPEGDCLDGSFAGVERVQGALLHEVSVFRPSCGAGEPVFVASVVRTDREVCPPDDGGPALPTPCGHERGVGVSGPASRDEEALFDTEPVLALQAVACGARTGVDARGDYVGTECPALAPGAVRYRIRAREWLPQMELHVGDAAPDALAPYVALLERAFAEGTPQDERSARNLGTADWPAP